MKQHEFKNNMACRKTNAEIFPLTCSLYIGVTQWGFLNKVDLSNVDIAR